MEKKIWHEYDINDMPAERKHILIYFDTDIYDTAVIFHEDWKMGCWNGIKKWAYISDLLASSKGLDVAAQGFLAISGYDIINADAETIKRLFLGVQDIADESLKEINTIMNGDK